MTTETRKTQADVLPINYRKSLERLRSHAQACVCGHAGIIHQDGGTSACEGFLTLFDGDPGPCYCSRFAAAGTLERIRGGR